MDEVPGRTVRSAANASGVYEEEAVASSTRTTGAKDFGAVSRSTSDDFRNSRTRRPRSVEDRAQLAPAAFVLPEDE